MGHIRGSESLKAQVHNPKTKEAKPTRQKPKAKDLQNQGGRANSQKGVLEPMTRHQGPKSIKSPRTPKSKGGPEKPKWLGYISQRPKTNNQGSENQSSGQFQKPKPYGGAGKLPQHLNRPDSPKNPLDNSQRHPRRKKMNGRGGPIPRAGTTRGS